MKLKAPTKAFRDGTRGKWHLPHRNYANMSVCNIIYWPENDGYVKKPIKHLKSTDICQKCLGPCKAVES